jgi:hypothetical protein
MVTICVCVPLAQKHSDCLLSRSKSATVCLSANAPVDITLAPPPLQGNLFPLCVEKSFELKKQNDLQRSHIFFHCSFRRKKLFQWPSEHFLSLSLAVPETFV